MVVHFLMLAIVWFVQHEIGILESNHTEEVASRAAHEKTMWDQIGKMTATQNDTALKLSNVGTQFADHQKDDDKFSATVADSLKAFRRKYVILQFHRREWHLLLRPSLLHRHRLINNLFTKTPT